MRLIREKVVGYIVAVNDKPTELCLADGMADIVEAERGSLKGTRLAFSSKPTLFPTRKAANRAIDRTKVAVRSSVMALAGPFGTAEYAVLPITMFVPVRFRQV